MCVCLWISCKPVKPVKRIHPTAEQTHSNIRLYEPYISLTHTLPHNQRLCVLIQVAVESLTPVTVQPVWGFFLSHLEMLSLSLSLSSFLNLSVLLFLASAQNCSGLFSGSVRSCRCSACVCVCVCVCVWSLRLLSVDVKKEAANVPELSLLGGDVVSRRSPVRRSCPATASSEDQRYS